MKKKLVSIMSVISMLMGGESEGCSMQTSILSGLINGTSNHRISVFHENIPPLVENSGTQVQLSLDYAWLRETLDKLNDPYFENRTGQFFANLVLSDSKNYKGAEFLFSSPFNTFFLQKPMSPEETDALLTGSILSPKYEYLSDGSKEKSNMIRGNFISMLQKIHDIVNSEGLNLAQKVELLLTTLPDRLIENIRANNRVFVLKKSAPAGMAANNWQFMSNPVSEESSSSASCPSINVFPKFLNDIKQYAIEEEDPTLKANLTSWLDRLSVELGKPEHVKRISLPGPIGSILNNFYKAVLSENDPELTAQMIQGLRFIRFMLKGIIVVDNADVSIPYVSFPSERYTEYSQAPWEISSPVTTTTTSSSSSSAAAASAGLPHPVAVRFPAINSEAVLSSSFDVDSSSSEMDPQPLSPAAIPNETLAASPFSRPTLPARQSLPTRGQKVSAAQRSIEPVIEPLGTPPAASPELPPSQAVVPHQGASMSSSAIATPSLPSVTLTIDTVGKMLFLINELLPIDSHGVRAFNPERLLTVTYSYDILDALTKDVKENYFPNWQEWRSHEIASYLYMAEHHHLGAILQAINNVLKFTFNGQPIFRTKESSPTREDILPPILLENVISFSNIPEALIVPLREQLYAFIGSLISPSGASYDFCRSIGEMALFRMQPQKTTVFPRTVMTDEENPHRLLPADSKQKGAEKSKQRRKKAKAPADPAGSSKSSGCTIV